MGRILRLLEPQQSLTKWAIHNVLSTQAESVVTHVKLPLMDGGEFSWPIACPQDLLPLCLSECAGFREVFEQALSAQPATFCRPWRLLIYLDEITPGNPLRPDNKRKIMAFYASWLELGDRLRLEEYWLTLGVLRTSIIKEVKGNLSAVFRHLMRTLLLGCKSLCNAGVVIELAESSLVCFSKYHREVSDEAAGKAVWNFKGAAGIKPCPSCKNVVKMGDDEDEAAASLASFDASGYLVDLACCDPHRFDPMQDADLWMAHDALEQMHSAPGVSNSALQQAERACGLSYHSEGLLADAELRALVKPSSYHRDPMHIMLSGGVMNSELYLVLRALSGVMPGFRYSCLKDFCDASWKWPRHRIKNNIGDVFSDVRETSSLAAKQFKAGASEVLAVYPLVRYFLEFIVPADCIPAEKAAFLKCCEVVDHMQIAKRDPRPEVLKKIKDLTAVFLRLHVQAHGNQHVRPKHHYMWHMTRQAEEDGFWVDCFVHERKHQLTKDASNHVKTPKALS